MMRPTLRWRTVVASKRTAVEARESLYFGHVRPRLAGARVLLVSMPDWDALAKEATDLLQRYIRVDTSNPPGNEALACDFLEEALSAEGIQSHRLTSAPGRDNLYADLPGSDPSAKPLILLNHTD